MKHHQACNAPSPIRSRVAVSILACLGLLAAGAALADAMYVTDQTEVTLRTGQSTSHAIKRMLPSGTRVEVLERDSDSGYIRVQTQEGADGWVLGRLLMGEPAARDQLAAMRQRVERIDQQNRELRTQIDSLQQANAALTTELNGLKNQNTTLSSDLQQVRTTSRDALNIAAENDVLRAQVADHEQTVDLLKAENAELKAHTTQRWFLIGAGVIVAGILLGLLLPRMRPRRRSSWGSL